MHNSAKLRVLLTDPQQRASLAAARALGAAGHYVVTIGTAKGLAGRSRSVTEHVHLAPDEKSSSVAYASCVLNAVKDFAIDVILPITDETIRMLLANEVSLGAPLASPHYQIYDAASDKYRMGQLASSVGIDVPNEYVADTQADLCSRAGSLLYPLVCKSRASVIATPNGAARTSVFFVDSPNQLVAKASALAESAYPLLCQQRIFGSGVGIFILRTQGKVRLQFGHRRIREKPPEGGVSTYRESWHPPLALLQRCEAMLESIDYEGVAMIEFKHDPLTNRYYLMEINARLWGSLQLAMDAGLDFATALVDWAAGRIVPSTPVLSYSSGVRSVWEIGEVDHLWALLKPNHSFAFRGARGFFAAAHVLRHRHILSDHLEVFRWRDPLPFFAELARWVRG